MCAAATFGPAREYKVGKLNRDIYDVCVTSYILISYEDKTNSMFGDTDNVLHDVEKEHPRR